MSQKKILVAFLLLALITIAAIFVVKNDANVKLTFENKNTTQEDYFEKKYADIYVSNIPMMVQTVPRDGNISLGIDTGIEKLNFGIVNVRTPVRKKLDFSNDQNVPVKVIMTTSGNISEYISIKTPKFVMEPGTKEEKILNFTGCPDGLNLSGTVLVKMIIPKYPALLWIY
ncbi:MAG: hypothetical protein KAR87_00075 [Candidatus Aenigmarchaeota archaeon]|nr:hypothetical protein [Candidatus Aenigmarchaeota archaeon]